jgi:hypothetical protein
MPDDEHNPYAPPAEPIRAFGESEYAAGPNDYESERRAVAVCVGLTLLTLGFYPTIWLFKRRPFLDRLVPTRSSAPRSRSSS